MRSDARLVSSNFLATLGVNMPAHLPSVDAWQLRAQEEITARLLCLNACGAVAYGFPPARASSWLEREGLQPFLQPEEVSFLGTGGGQRERFQYQIEGAYALAWALGLHDHLDHRRHCSDQFVFLMPNLKTDESSSRLRQNARLRPVHVLLEAADLAYCLHWALREAPGSNLPFPMTVVEERRRALEWLFTDEAWYELSLDT